MQKTVRTQLSEKDLDKWIKQMNSCEKLMKICAKNIVDDLSKFGAKKMKNIHNKSSFQSSDDMQFIIEGNDFSKTVKMQGTQALYEEFGTGTMGAQNPHPTKDAFGLNPYNSGKTIRKASAKVSEKTGIKEGDLYWTYTDSTGQKVYTQGIPAIKPGYDSFQATLKHAPTVVKKRTEEVIERVVKE